MGQELHNLETERNFFLHIWWISMLFSSTHNYVLITRNHHIVIENKCKIHILETGDCILLDTPPTYQVKAL